MANETNQKLENEELTVEEVNVYAANCGGVKACQMDCLITQDCWLTCQN